MTDKKKLTKGLKNLHEINIAANKCIKNALENAYWEDEVIITNEGYLNYQNKNLVNVVLKVIKNKVTLIIQDLK